MKLVNVIVILAMLIAADGRKKWKKSGKKSAREKIEDSLSRDCRFWKNPYKHIELLNFYRPRPPPKLYYYWDTDNQWCSPCTSCQMENLQTLQPCTFFSDTVCSKYRSSHSWDSATTDLETVDDSASGYIKYEADAPQESNKVKEEVYGKPVYLPENTDSYVSLSDSLRGRKVPKNMKVNEELYGRPKFYQNDSARFSLHGQEDRPILSILKMLKNNRTGGGGAALPDLADDKFSPSGRSRSTSEIINKLNIIHRPKTPSTPPPPPPPVPAKPRLNLGKDSSSKQRNSFGSSRKNGNSQYTVYIYSTPAEEKETTTTGSLPPASTSPTSPHGGGKLLYRYRDQKTPTPTTGPPGMVPRVGGGGGGSVAGTGGRTNGYDPDNDLNPHINLGFAGAGGDEALDPKLSHSNVYNRSPYQSADNINNNNKFDPMGIEPHYDISKQDSTNKEDEIPRVSSKSFFMEKMFICVSLVLIVLLLAIISVLLRSKYARTRFKLLDNSDGVSSYQSLSPYQEVSTTSLPGETYNQMKKKSKQPATKAGELGTKVGKSPTAFKSPAFQGNQRGTGGSTESLQMHRRPSKSNSATFSLSPEDQCYKELVTLSSGSPDQPYKELVTLSSRSTKQLRTPAGETTNPSAAAAQGWEIVSHQNIPCPSVGVASRIQSRDPPLPRELDLPNPSLPSGTSGAVPAFLSTATNVPFPASVARSLRNINPSRDNLKKFQESVGQTFDGLRSTCQTLAYN